MVFPSALPPIIPRTCPWSILPDETFKLKLSYNIITKYSPAKPCIKRYLFSQVQGSGLYGISGEDWSYAAALPLQKFVGKQPW